MQTIDSSRGYAAALDAADAMGRLRERFYTLPGRIYMDGNSLGLLSRDAESLTLAMLERWKSDAIGGWWRGEPNWFDLPEELAALLAAMVGAAPDCVAVTGTTTVNIHALLTTFYQPQDRRRKILADELDFPSDIYAIKGQIVLHGGDPQRELVRVASRDGRIIEEDDIVAAMTDEVAVALLPSALYRSGQLLDIERLTAAAHERGILIGFDCAHSIGAIPHHFDAWDVDFALWCGYKYLNGGPGTAGGLYVNRRHHGRTPGLPGWIGVDPAVRFQMRHHFDQAPGAAAWQISTPSALATAAQLGAARISTEAGIEAIRARSLALTDYLIALVEARGLTAPPYDYTIGTPRQHQRRGGHVAVEHERAESLTAELEAHGIIPDFRQPNVIRLAPVALYTTFTEVWDTVEALRQVANA